MPPSYATSPAHRTLTANTELDLLFSADYDTVEVLNVDGAAAVYFRVDGTAPGVAQDGSHVLAAAAGAAVELSVPTSGPTSVKLISAGTPAVSVRGVSP